MRMNLIKSKVLCVAWVLSVASAGAIAQEWQPLDPEQVLVMDTSRGRMLIEMRPDMAPMAVERVKRLSREGLYNGLQFHRVIAGFVAQTGNPNNRDGGVSPYANLPSEFVFRLRLDPAVVLAGVSSDATRGLIGSVPFEGTPPVPDTKANGQTIRAWGAYCAGVAGMGRQEEKDTGNSEIFFMFQPARRLDHDYTVWGRIIAGMDVLQSLAVGEPPAQPDTMVRVRLLSDVPAYQRPVVAIATPDRVLRLIQKARSEKGADFSVCDVAVPIQLKEPR
jgi:peptidylprolyl isomerase